MVYQYYIMEIQQYQDGSYGDIKHFAWDADPDAALRKAKAKYFEILSAAYTSQLPKHSVILFASDGFPVMHECVEKVIVPTPEPALEVEE